MLTITKKLDMSPHGVPQVIRVSQYDSDFTLEFKLFASGGNFAISTGTTAEIRGTKQSGTGYSASATLDTSTKVVTVAGAAQMTAVAGMNIFEIVLKKNNKEISSANFCLLVERAALDADTITDESVLKELNSIIESADTATQAAEEAEDAADRAEAAAQTLVTDPAPIEGSAHAVSSGGVYEALQSAGFPENVKTALLACFEHVAWTDEHGQNYYDALESALYADQYPKITATFNSGTNTIYTDDDISSLKQYLTVKYYADRSSAGQIISANDYTLTGMLTEGTSTMFVAYNNLTTVFTINGVVDFYNTWEWSDALYRTPSNTTEKIINNVKRGIEYGSYGISSNNRRSFVVLRGKSPIIDQDRNPTEYYPVPIPKTATKLTATITPSTQQFASYVYRYEGNVNPNGYNYLMIAPSSISWKTGVDVVEFTAGENLFVGFNCRKNASSEQYTDATEPTLNIVFE